MPELAAHNGMRHLEVQAPAWYVKMDSVADTGSPLLTRRQRASTVVHSLPGHRNPLKVSMHTLMRSFARNHKERDEGDQKLTMANSSYAEVPGAKHDEANMMHGARWGTP